MNRWTLVKHSMSYHRRSHLTVALGVAAATAVLVGALVVGDSVRQSLERLTIDRLGKIDYLLVSNDFFREQLVQDFSKDAGVDAVGVMLVPQGTLEYRSDEQLFRTNGVMVIGADESFWKLRADGTPQPKKLPNDDQIVLNRTLASALNAQVGDMVTVRVGATDTIPADTPFGDSEDTIRSRPELEVTEILADEGFGRFSLHPSQTLPSVAFVSIGTMREVLEQPDRFNGLVVSQPANSIRALFDGQKTLQQRLRPQLDDLGLQLQRQRPVYPREAGAAPVYDYYSLSSSRMLLPQAADAAVTAAFGNENTQPVFTYLANTIAVVGSDTRPIPYSLVASIDNDDQFPLVDLDGNRIKQLDANQIVLNQWTAEQLKAEVGDQVQLTFFEPETTLGETREQTAKFELVGVTPLVKPSVDYFPDQISQYDQTPSLANDPRLTPEVKGFSDQESIDSWDVPFAIDYDLIEEDIDDPYWQTYASTPKAFVSLAAGRELWGNRFGKTTSWRIDAQHAGDDEAAVAAKLLAQLDLEDYGFAIQAIKARQLNSSRGTTPFDVLFLSLSFFVIVAALLLVVLLFRLGLDRRTREVGVLLSLGYTHRDVARLLTVETLLVSAVGGLAGVLLGCGYASLMIWGLTTIWVGAVTTAFLSFHASPLSLGVGYLLGVAASVGAILLSVRKYARLPARRLLVGRVEQTLISVQGSGRWVWIGAGVLLLAAIALASYAATTGGIAQGGAFVGAGSCVLMASFLLIWQRLRRSAADDREFGQSRPLVQLAESGARRNPARSMLTMGLIAFSSFLIVAMSAFRMTPTREAAGGFDLVGHSSQPVFADLNDPDQRQDILGSDADQLNEARVYSLRLRPGDDASCNNLYRAVQPRVIGITQGFVEHFDRAEAVSFPWAGTQAESEQDTNNPWRLLPTADPTTDGPIPCVLDKNTAMYSLQLYRGVGERFTFEYDQRDVEFEVVGLVSNTILQGAIVVGEADFRKTFPDVNGYRYFLAEAPAAQRDQTRSLLEDVFGDQGLAFETTTAVLTSLLAVQNTYISTFQVLGALGLLLGTFGLATVQVRSVLERQSEIAVMRAIGFRRTRIATLVFLENLALLTGGLLAGVLSAAIAVLPYKLLGGMTLPLDKVSLMLVAIFVIGTLSGIFAVASTLRLPLLASLRRE